MLAKFNPLWILLLLVAGCSVNNRKQQETNSDWDSKAFFQNEIQSLTQQSYRLHKELQFGNKIDTILIDTPNWNKELETFLEIDLLKPIYKGRLKKDTLFISDTEYRIQYIALDSTTDLRSCLLICRQNPFSIKEIQAVFSTNNSLYHSIKTLRYQSGIGYHIIGNQKANLAREMSYTVNGKLIP